LGVQFPEAAKHWTSYSHCKRGSGDLIRNVVLLEEESRKYNLHRYHEDTTAITLVPVTGFILVLVPGVKADCGVKAMKATEVGGVSRPHVVRFGSPETR